MRASKEGQGVCNMYNNYRDLSARAMFSVQKLMLGPEKSFVFVTLYSQ